MLYSNLQESNHIKKEGPWDKNTAATGCTLSFDFPGDHKTIGIIVDSPVFTLSPLSTTQTITGSASSISHITGSLSHANGAITFPLAIEFEYRADKTMAIYLGGGYVGAASFADETHSIRLAGTFSGFYVKEGPALRNFTGGEEALDFLYNDGYNVELSRPANASILDQLVPERAEIYADRYIKEDRLQEYEFNVESVLTSNLRILSPEELPVLQHSYLSPVCEVTKVPVAASSLTLVDATVTLPAFNLYNLSVELRVRSMDSVLIAAGNWTIKLDTHVEMFGKRFPLPVDSTVLFTRHRGKNCLYVNGVKVLEEFKATVESSASTSVAGTGELEAIRMYSGVLYDGDYTVQELVPYVLRTTTDDRVLINHKNFTGAV